MLAAPACQLSTVSVGRKREETGGSPQTRLMIKGCQQPVGSWESVCGIEEDGALLR